MSYTIKVKDKRVVGITMIYGVVHGFEFSFVGIGLIYLEAI